jgi:hypothetical protein
MPRQQDKETEASSSPTPMQRAEDLLSKMTIEEKAMQLSCIYPMASLASRGPYEGSLTPN